MKSVAQSTQNRILIYRNLNLFKCLCLENNILYEDVKKIIFEIKDNLLLKTRIIPIHKLFQGIEIIKYTT